MYIGFQVAAVLGRFQCTLTFPNKFSKNIPVSNFMKIRPVGAEFFQADKRTDMMKLTVAFRNSANSSKRAVYHRKAQNMPNF
jgi:hypothetical protein